MTSKSDFSEDEWARVVRAPLVAGMAIMVADPGGPIEATKETMASIRIATNPPTREQLLTEVALDVQAEVQAKRNPLKGFKPSGTSGPGDQVLAELTAVQGIVAARATEEEAAAFGRWLVAAHRRRPMRRRTAGSWASAPCWSANMSRRCSNGCARPLLLDARSGRWGSSWLRSDASEVNGEGEGAFSVRRHAATRWWLPNPSTTVHTTNRSSGQPMFTGASESSSSDDSLAGVPMYFSNRGAQPRSANWSTRFWPGQSSRASVERPDDLVGVRLVARHDLEVEVVGLHVAHAVAGPEIRVVRLLPTRAGCVGWFLHHLRGRGRAPAGSSMRAFIPRAASPTVTARVEAPTITQPMCMRGPGAARRSRNRQSRARYATGR